MNPKYIVCLLLVALASSAVAQTNWNGEWTWECYPNEETQKCFPGTVYTCVDGDSIHGEYSGVGKFEGTIDGDLVFGSWIEAGYTDNASGGFVWQLNDDDDSFAGEWWFGEDSCRRFRRDGRRELNAAESARCLANVEGGTSLNGHWQKGLALHGLDDLFICVDDQEGTYAASWNINVQSADGYSLGRVLEDGTTLQGSFWTGPDGSDVATQQGIELIRQVGPDTIIINYYDVVSTFDIENLSSNYDAFTDHEAVTYTRIDRGNVNCRANNHLVHEDDRQLWSGTWTDHTNGEGRFYICVDGDRASGVYSEYGFISGTIDDNNDFSGRWVSSGLDDSFGTFHWSLNGDATKFEGTFTIDGVDGTFDSSETRIDVTDDNLPAECYNLVGGRASIEGTFITSSDDKFDFCINEAEGTIVGSYDIGRSRGTIEGRTYDNGKSIQYVWSEQFASGVGVMRLTEENTLFDFWWVDPVPDPFYALCDFTDEDDVQANAYFVQQHDVFEYKRALGNGDCLRNFNIEVDSPSSSSSDASAIAVSVLLVAAAFAVAMI